VADEVLAAAPHQRQKAETQSGGEGVQAPVEVPPSVSGRTLKQQWARLIKQVYKAGRSADIAVIVNRASVPAFVLDRCIASAGIAAGDQTGRGLRNRCEGLFLFLL